MPRATSTFSSTVREVKGLTIWKVRPRPRAAMACGASPSMRRPSNRISPPEGL